MPSDYFAPGVYVEEIPNGPRVIAARPTGVTAFLGAARKGASYRAYEIKSFTEFTTRFGPLKTELELGYAVSQFFANGGTSAWVMRIAQRPTVAQFQRGLAALDRVEDFDLLAVPGGDSASARDAALAYAQSRRAFLILDAPRAATSVALMHGAEATLPVSADAAVYFPWVELADPAGATPGAKRLSAPSGSVAGVVARIDGRRGVWKAPAGTEATLNGVTSLAVTVTNQENDELNILGVNCLREFPVQNRLIFGARTRVGGTAGGSEWKYVNVRRFALFLERSLNRGLQWAVFEPNDEPLWAKIRASVENFLFLYFRQGAFQGSKVNEACFVKCDRSTITGDDISAGVVNVLVGFAPLKPAEFLILKLSLKTQAA
jgi:phage tail sheath protein FI